MAGAIIERLAGPTLIEDGADATLYTATSKTLIRTIDIGVVVAELADTGYVGVNGLGSQNGFFLFSLDAVAHFQWRGGMVLNAGDTISTGVDTTTAADYTITICGVTNLPAD